MQKSIIPKNLSTDIQMVKRIDEKVFSKEKISDDLLNINFSDLKNKVYQNVEYAKLPKSLAVIQDSFFRNRDQKVCYKIFYPGEVVKLDMIENMAKLFFFIFSNDPKTKEVITFTQPLKIKDIELPEFKKPLTTDTVLCLNNLNIFNITSNIETREDLFPPCFVKGTGKFKSDFIYKNPFNRIIIIAEK